MKNEKKIVRRYFGGETLNGSVRALKAQNFEELMANYVRTPNELEITHAQFWKMTKAERSKAKEVPYIVPAVFRESPSHRRTDDAIFCNLIFLDIDEEKDGECPAAKFVNDKDSLAEALTPFAFAAYTTASSTSEKPRMRVVVSANDIPLNRYPEAVMNVAKRMGLENVTPESKTAVQPMFFPTIFSDRCPILDDPLLVENKGRAFEVSDLNSPVKSERTEEGEDEEELNGEFLRHLKSRDPEITLRIAKKALKFIDPDLTYCEWVNIAASLKHQFSPEDDEAAYQLFDDWSAYGDKYKSADDTRLKWDSLTANPRDRAPITIGTLFKLAEAGGWKNPKCVNPSKSEAVAIPDFRSCLIHARTLATMDIPKRARLLDNWFCQGDLGYIFAARGVGKTWMVMALLRAVSQKTDLGAWRAGEKKCRVLYVDGEMPLQLTQFRSRTLDMESGDVTFLHHETVFDGLETSLNIGREDHRVGITDLIKSEEYDVLVLDNLSALAFGVDENKGEDYDPLKEWLLGLRRQKVTVIVIHHAGKSGLMRGHSKREDDCSWILELKDAKEDGDDGAKFTSHFAKPSRNTGDSQPELIWHLTTKNDILTIKCEEAAAGEYQQFIRHVNEGVERQKDIADLMQKREGTISKWAKRAIEEGRIIKTGQRLLPIIKHIAPEAEDLDILDDLF